MLIPSIEELVLSGAIEVAGIDEATGEFLYNFTDKMEEALPALHSKKLAFIQEQLMYFFEAGMVEIQNAFTRNPIFILTELAFDEELIDELPPDKKKALEEIKRLFER